MMVKGFKLMPSREMIKSLLFQSFSNFSATGKYTFTTKPVP
jgi:hypothetical protein